MPDKKYQRAGAVDRQKHKISRQFKMQSTPQKSSHLKSAGLGRKEFKKDLNKTQQEKDAKRKEILKRVQHRALTSKDADNQDISSTKLTVKHPTKLSRSPKSIPIIDSENLTNIDRSEKKTLSRACPRKKKHTQKKTVDECIIDEKQKPWIENFHGTLLKPTDEEDIENNKLFSTITTKESTDFPGWYIPSDTYYSKICKIDEHFITSQKGSQLTITILNNSQNDLQDSKENQNTITIIVGNIIDDKLLKIYPGAQQQKNSSKWVIPENTNYIEARTNYLSTKFKTNDVAIEELLSMPYKNIFDDKSMYNSVILKIKQYIENFKNKIPSSELNKAIVDIYREKQLTLDSLLTMIVEKTIYFRDEFDGINNNIIFQLQNNMIKPKQLFNMTQYEIIPELYNNFVLDIMAKGDILQRAIDSKIKEIVKNLALSILLSKMHVNLDSEKEFVDTDILLINDIIPFQNICTLKTLQDQGDNITIEDIKDIGNIIFYKSDDNQIYAFTIDNIKTILSNNDGINPLSGKPFNEKFIKHIKKYVKSQQIDNQNTNTYNDDTLAIDNQTRDSDVSTDLSTDGSEDAETIDDEDHDDDDEDHDDDDDDDHDDEDHGIQQYKMRYPNFIDNIVKLVENLKAADKQYNFEVIEQDIKEEAKPHFCFACSKKLVNVSDWSTTINIDKKNGEFVKNSYHIKCLYNAPFKI